MVLPDAHLNKSLLVPEKLKPGMSELVAQVDFQDNQPVQAVKRIVEIREPEFSILAASGSR